MAQVIDIHPKTPTEIASQIWGLPQHANKTFDPDLCESVMKEIEREQRHTDAWMNTAAQHLRNECYYRGIIQDIGELFGEDAFISDDGSRQQDVLCAKVLDLVRGVVASHTKD